MRIKQPHHAPTTDATIQGLIDFLDGKAKKSFEDHPMDPPTFKAKTGKKNVKIITVNNGEERGVWGFVEIESGCVMKAGGCSAPEPKKHERGNVNQPEKFESCGMDHYGPAYR